MTRQTAFSRSFRVYALTPSYLRKRVRICRSVLAGHGTPAAWPRGGRMTPEEAMRTLDMADADHAGSALVRLLIGHPEVIDIEILGQSEVIEGTISYSLGVMLPGGRELYIDVEDG